MTATDSLSAPPAPRLRRVACIALARAGTLLRAASVDVSTEVPPDALHDVLHDVVGEARLARAAWRLGRSTGSARLCGDVDQALAELHGRLPGASSVDRVVAAREAARFAGLPVPSDELEAWLAVAGAAGRRTESRSDPARMSDLVHFAGAARQILVAGPWAPDEDSAVDGALRRATSEVRDAIVRAGRGACRRLDACRGPLDELRHALRALARASARWRATLAAPARDVEGLAALAGRDHDQALLRATLSRADVPSALTTEAAGLRVAVDADRDRVRALARPLLARLFGEPGGALGRAPLVGVRPGDDAPATPSGSGHRRLAGSAR